MPENQKGPSPFMFWLEEALSGWILPLAAVALVLCTGALYMVGVASENLTGGLLVVVAPLVVAVIMVRPAFESARSSTSRGLVCAAAGVTLLVAAVPAFRSIFPG